MNAIVTARVPVEVKNQVSQILADLGSSPTELINSAYDYVLAHGKLPTDDTTNRAIEAHRNERRTLSAAQKAKLMADLGSMQLGPVDGYDGSNYKDLLNAARDERYAPLA